RWVSRRSPRHSRRGRPTDEAERAHLRTGRHRNGDLRDSRTTRGSLRRRVRTDSFRRQRKHVFELRRLARQQGAFRSHTSSDAGRDPVSAGRLFLALLCVAWCACTPSAPYGVEPTSPRASSDVTCQVSFPSVAAAVSVDAISVFVFDASADQDGSLCPTLLVKRMTQQLL